MDIKDRIKKDIGIFNQNILKIDKSNVNKQIRNVIELSIMYATDANFFLEKKDLYTSFSCISYAHGLLDAVIKILDENNN